MVLPVVPAAAVVFQKIVLLRPVGQELLIKDMPVARVEIAWVPALIPAVPEEVVRAQLDQPFQEQPEAQAAQACPIQSVDQP